MTKKGALPTGGQAEIGDGGIFYLGERLVGVRAARRGSFRDKYNADGGAGPIEPAPFQGDPALVAVKDASRRRAVGPRPILDRDRARGLVDGQAGTKKRLPRRTKKRMTVSGTTTFRQLNRVTRPSSAHSPGRDRTVSASVTSRRPPRAAGRRRCAARGRASDLACVIHDIAVDSVRRAEWRPEPNDKSLSATGCDTPGA
jgi:hypothetical protein